MARLLWRRLIARMSAFIPKDSCIIGARARFVKRGGVFFKLGNHDREDGWHNAA